MVSATEKGWSSSFGLSGSNESELQKEKFNRKDQIITNAHINQYLAEYKEQTEKSEFD